MNLEPTHEEQLHEGSTFPMGDPCCLDGGEICLGRFRLPCRSGKRIAFWNLRQSIWFTPASDAIAVQEKTRFSLGSDVAVRMVCFVHNAMDLSCNMRGSSRLKK